MRLKTTLWTAAAALVFGLVSVRSETVVISEIIYHAPGNKPEYIEIYNNTLTPLDIADWRLRGAWSMTSLLCSLGPGLDLPETV